MASRNFDIAAYQIASSHHSTRDSQVLERVTGIEPALPAWEAGVLPLNYTRKVLSITCQEQIQH